MSDTAVLRDLVVVFAAALPIVFVFQRLRIPPVAGFLMAGILIGPHGIGLIPHTAHVDSLAEIGLIWLLFIVGLELSLAQLARLGRVVISAGLLQVAVTAVIVTAITVALLPFHEGIVLGFLIVHSSTAVVLKLLAARGEMDAPHGRIATGILIVQDLALVPMMLLIRVLGDSTAAWSNVAWGLLEAAGGVVAIVVGGRVLLTAALRHIVRLHNRELFTGSVVFFCVSTAWLASQLGLSLAIGALIAGLVLSESDYSHQAISDILPLRDTLNSVFFISIGMLVPLGFLVSHLPALFAAALAVMAFKAIIIHAVVLPSYPSFRVAASTALALAALGELSFVVARFAVSSGLMPAVHYEWFVAIAVLSMLVAPLLINNAPALTQRMEALLRVRPTPAADIAPVAPRDVAIIGYGLNGENLAHVLRETGLRYVIVEMNPERVAEARQRGEPMVFGDASRREVLQSLSIARVKVIVVAISDPHATRRIVALLRQLEAAAPIIVRTRYVAEIEELQRLGATEVIPEEFETSVEIFARVLRRLHVPRNVIDLQVQLIRRGGYGMLRGLELPAQTLSQLDQILAATTTETFLVADRSPAVGVAIRDLRLRSRSGATIIAIVRDSQPITNPEIDLEIRAGDIIVLVGAHEQLDKALSVLGGESPEGT